MTRSLNRTPLLDRIQGRRSAAGQSAARPDTAGDTRIAPVPLPSSGPEWVRRARMNELPGKAMAL